MRIMSRFTLALIASFIFSDISNAGVHIQSQHRDSRVANNEKCAKAKIDREAIAQQQKIADYPGKAYEIERKKFRETVSSLHNQGLITMSDYKLFESFISTSLREIMDKELASKSKKIGTVDAGSKDLIMRYINSQVALEKKIDSWIAKGLIQPYFHRDAIDMGMRVFELSGKDNNIVLNNAECFQSWEVDLVKTVAKFKAKPGWKSKKAGSDFISVYTKYNRPSAKG